MVAFGVAPALMVYSWSLSHLGKLGWMAAFLYAVGLRCAWLFNTQSHDDKRYFRVPVQRLRCCCLEVYGWDQFGVWKGFVAIPVSALTYLPQR